jgi:hypothetical protein
MNQHFFSKAGDMPQMAECLPSKHEAQSLHPALPNQIRLRYMHYLLSSQMLFSEISHYTLIVGS